MNDKLKEYIKNIDGVSHITFDPKGPDVVRIHLIPPKKIKLGISWIVLINGEYILPITCSWAILLREFINHINEYEGKEISDLDLDLAIKETVTSMHKIYPKTNKKLFKEDLEEIISVILDLSKGKEVKSEIGYMSIKKYAPYMRAPLRMDLMVSSMNKDGHWHCNQKCLNCYAAGEIKGNEEELSTNDWKKIIDKLRNASIPQITFTGGEPTLREDLVELVEYSSWFVTRLNTNGQLLTKELCDELYNASLDNVQITLYSSNPNIHNLLVGTNGYDLTIKGIENAVSSGLQININTPLCSLNKDYLNTIDYLYHTFGIRYFTCSGLILTGSAKDTKETRLSEDELYEILKEAEKYCDDNGLDLKFTSPGWISEDKLKELSMTLPMCGASLSNMAVSPSGDVIPCQSWLDGTSFGSLLNKKFDSIWNSKELKALRHITLKNSEYCPLSEREKYHEENN